VAQSFCGSNPWQGDWFAHKQSSHAFQLLWKVEGLLVVVKWFLLKDSGLILMEGTPFKFRRGFPCLF